VHEQIIRSKQASIIGTKQNKTKDEETVIRRVVRSFPRTQLLWYAYHTCILSSSSIHPSMIRRSRSGSGSGSGFRDGRNDYRHRAGWPCAPLHAGTWNYLASSMVHDDRSVNRPIHRSSCLITCRNNLLIINLHWSPAHHGRAGKLIRLASTVALCLLSNHLRSRALTVLSNHLRKQCTVRTPLALGRYVFTHNLLKNSRCMCKLFMIMC
jgi:hypothetical protein